MPSGSYQSPIAIIDFATRYYDDLNRIVENRMRQLEVPGGMIGIRGWHGIDEGRAFVRFPDTQIGGNSNPFFGPNRPAGIALDHGIFDPDHPYMKNVTAWLRAAVRDRMDAAIVHEYIEATLTPPVPLTGVSAQDWLHDEAIRRAPSTKMPTSKRARQILNEYRQVTGLKP